MSSHGSHLCPDFMKPSMLAVWAQPNASPTEFNMLLDAEVQRLTTDL